jgi:hypothetical protein
MAALSPYLPRLKHYYPFVALTAVAFSGTLHGAPTEMELNERDRKRQELRDGLAQQVAIKLQAQQQARHHR